MPRDHPLDGHVHHEVVPALNGLFGAFTDGQQALRKPDFQGGFVRPHVAGLQHPSDVNGVEL